MSEQRQTDMNRLRISPDVDVVVVGGGINGIGVYRELALQGLRVVLVEREDFCSGCSAAPSRMIHGGLRYLENGEFDLVRESLFERDALLRNAPHMVRPLATMFPVTSVWSGLFNAAASFLGRQGKPARRGAVPIKLGLTLYDWVTYKRRALPRHEFVGRAGTRTRWPALMPAAKWSAVYYDAWISYPERLCIELLRDVARDAPECEALNYSELRVTGGGYEIADLQGGGTLPVAPRAIVNATGAWVDTTARAIGNAPAKPMVSGTKGSHLILENPALYEALGGHMVYYENTDGRICIVFPYLGRVLAGSTDIRVEAARRVRCEPEEQAYMLDSLRLVFPGIDVRAEDVVFSYSGIRPLPKSDHDYTGRISRGHSILRLDGPVPQFCMIGGKWTTFRAFGEQTADAVLAELGRSRRVSTRDMAIGGGADFGDPPGLARALTTRFGLSPERAAYLLETYGSGAVAVAEFCQARGAAALAPGLELTDAEVLWSVEHEFAQTVSDIVLRRSALAITGQVSMEIIDRIAAVIGTARGLTAEAVAAQKTALVEELAAYHGVSADRLVARDKERRTPCA